MYPALTEARLSVTTEKNRRTAVIDCRPRVWRICAKTVTAEAARTPVGRRLAYLKRSGAQRLPPDHADERDEDHRADERDDERDDQPGRSCAEDEREDEPTDERSDHAEDDVRDDAVAVAAHDLARQ